MSKYKKYNEDKIVAMAMQLREDGLTYEEIFGLYKNDENDRQ